MIFSTTKTLPDGQRCDVCGDPATDGCGAYDEDDRFWCVPCMGNWEMAHGRRWEDGAPLRRTASFIASRPKTTLAQAKAQFEGSRRQLGKA